MSVRRSRSLHRDRLVAARQALSAEEFTRLAATLRMAESVSLPSVGPLLDGLLLAWRNCSFLSRMRMHVFEVSALMAGVAYRAAYRADHIAGTGNSGLGGVGSKW